MVHIQTTKTFTGEKNYSVVEKFILDGKDDEGKDIKIVDYLPVDYKVGKILHTAVFPHTEMGLKEAKKVQELFNKGKTGSNIM